MASAVQPLGAGFTVALAYTYLDAKNGNGVRLERRPRHSATLRLDWQQGPWRVGGYVEHAADQLLPAGTANTPAQPVPDLTMLGAQASVALPGGIDASLGVRNLTNPRLAEKSPLFTQVEAPRNRRLALRGKW